MQRPGSVNDFPILFQRKVHAVDMVKAERDNNSPLVLTPRRSRPLRRSASCARTSSASPVIHESRRCDASLQVFADNVCDRSPPWRNNSVHSLCLFGCG